jgi:hypothetical protein
MPDSHTRLDGSNPARATASSDQIKAAGTEAFKAAFSDRPFRTPLQAIAVTVRKPEG